MAGMKACKKDSFKFVFFFQIGRNGCHLQQLVTAKLFATSRLSMWGVSLNSEVPNWTIPIRKALYSWSAPLGNSPPEIDRNRLEIQFAVFYIETPFLPHCLSTIAYKFVVNSVFFLLLDTYQFEHWASLQARIPIKPAEPKRINSLSFPCPQFRCPHPPQESDIPCSLLGC